MAEEAEITDDLFENIIEMSLIRCKDQVGAIRVEAFNV